MIWIGRAAVLVLVVVAGVLLGQWLGSFWSWVVPIVVSTVVGPAIFDHWRHRDRDARGEQPRINGTGANGQDTTH